jgi:hypothetical protein
MSIRGWLMQWLVWIDGLIDGLIDGWTNRSNQRMTKEMIDIRFTNLKKKQDLSFKFLKY